MRSIRVEQFGHFPTVIRDCWMILVVQREVTRFAIRRNIKKYATLLFSVSLLAVIGIERIKVDTIIYPHVISLLLFLMLMRMPRGSVRKDVDSMLLCCVSGKYKELG